jgi:hypothetical protein
MKPPLAVMAWLGKKGFGPNGRWYEETLGVLSAVFCSPYAKRRAQADSVVTMHNRKRNLGFEQKHIAIRNLIPEATIRQRLERSGSLNETPAISLD